MISTFVQHLVTRLKGSDLIRGFAITTIGSGISKAIMIASTFYCTHRLTQTEFGEFSFINNTLIMILTICATNFSRICTKFATEAKESKEAIQRLFILFLFSFLSCTCASFLILVLPDSVLTKVFGSTSMTTFLRFSALLLPLFMLHPLIEGVLRGLMRFKLISYIQVLAALFYFSALIIGIQIGGVDGAIVALLVYYAVFALAFLICILRIAPISEFSHYLVGFWSERSVISKMVLPVFLASFVEAPMFWFLQVLLSRYSSIASIGGMTVIKQVRNFALLVPNYFFNTYIAFAGKLNAEKKYDHYFNQFDQLIRDFCWVGVGIFIVFSLLSKQILWLYKPEYVSNWGSLIISNACFPLALVLSLVKTDLILQEHQRGLLFISIFWNLVWILSFYLLIKMSFSPLPAFFGGELIALITQLIGCFLFYNYDKKRLLNK